MNMNQVRRTEPHGARTRSVSKALAAAALMLAFAAPCARAQDTTPPARVKQLTAVKAASDAGLSWAAVTTDTSGNPETIDHYNVYRGLTENFTPDRTGHTNRIGAPTTVAFPDPGAAADAGTYYYLVTATDTSGNEGKTGGPASLTPPLLSGKWTTTTLDLTWTASTPAPQVAGYRVYYGRASRSYDSSVDVGMSLTHNLTGLLPNTMYYCAVVALDAVSNESPLSNEYVDVLDGRITLRAHDHSQICPDPGVCPPKGNEIQRSGWQIMVPVDFPPGNWTNIKLTLTMESRLCDAPRAPDKCGDQNPGWNPCGDPWDRTASVFLVLDDCIDTGSGCFGRNGNIELLRAITPFGTDAPAPDGDGRVPPRVLEYDITPYAPVLKGLKHVGATISTWVSPGWWVTTDFRFSKNPADYTFEMPSSGVAPVLFSDDGADSVQGLDVTIPATATLAYVRLFTTGHGGNNDPACGQPADEFCPRVNRILVDGNPVWSATVWKNCSSSCGQWNACGYPSCLYDRSGWCPGEIACHDPSAACDQDLLAFDGSSINWFAPLGSPHTVSYEVVGRMGSWTKSLAVYWYE